MAGEEAAGGGTIQALVVDNGSGMCKVRPPSPHTPTAPQPVLNPPPPRALEP